MTINTYIAQLAQNAISQAESGGGVPHTAVRDLCASMAGIPWVLDKMQPEEQMRYLLMLVIRELASS
jgi:hypothetical protein